MKAYVTNSVSRFRKDKGITQEAFADLLSVSRQTIIAIEKGNYIPSLLLGLKIAKLFNRRVEEVFTYYEK